MKDKLLKNNNQLEKNNPTSSKSLELSSLERQQATASVSICSVLESLEKNILEQVQWEGVSPTPLGTVRSYGPP